MSDIILIIAVGTTLFLLLGVFIAFMTIVYQKRRQQHQDEVTSLVLAYQKEILKAQIEMQEQTFLLISQEIHDNVGQVLSLVRLNISTLEVEEASASAHKVFTSKALLDQAIQDLRNLSKQLNSNYIAQQNLSNMLKHQLDLIRKTGTCDTYFDLIGKEWSLAPEKKLIVFRIAQEALNNALRHAEASTITVRLAFEPARMTLHISDDGKGFRLPQQPPEGSPAGGTGTANMHYRTRLIGATLQIESAPLAGTLVSLILPNH